MIRQRGGATRRRDDQDDETELLRRGDRAAAPRGPGGARPRPAGGPRPPQPTDHPARGAGAGRPRQPPRPGPGPVHPPAIRRLPRPGRRCTGPADDRRLVRACRPPTPAGARNDNGSAVTNVVAAVTTGPDHLRAFTQTGQVPKVGCRLHGRRRGLRLRRGHAVPPPAPSRSSPTRSSGRASGPWPGPGEGLRAPRALKVITWVPWVLLLVVALAGSVILPTAADVAGLGPHPAGGRTRRRPRHGRGATTGQPTQAAPVVPDRFQRVRLHLLGQHPGLRRRHHHHRPLLGAGHQLAVRRSRLVVGVQPAGRRLSYPAQGTMTVQVGSSAVVVGVSVKGRVRVLQRPALHPLHLRLHPRPVRPDRRPRAAGRRRGPAAEGSVDGGRRAGPRRLGVAANSASSWAS